MVVRALCLLGVFVYLAAAEHRWLSHDRGRCRVTRSPGRVVWREFVTQDSNVWWGFDPQSNFVTIDTDDGYGDRFAEPDSLALPAR